MKRKAKAKFRVGPRVTFAQRKLLWSLWYAPHESAYSSEIRTVSALVYKGLVETWGIFTGVALTRRGHDFVRFRLRPLTRKEIGPRRKR